MTRTSRGPAPCGTAAARALRAALAVLVLVAGVPLLAAAPAQATGYRFWSYWHGAGGGWGFAGVGADSWRLQDGAVEGWRFAVSPTTSSSPRPRGDAAGVWQLAACRTLVAGTGEVRAAVVIDFGDATDYADGQRPPSDPVRVWCGVLPARSTGMDLLNLASGGELRTDGGMVCGISGFPARGCSEAAQEVPRPPTAGATSEPPRTKATQRPTHRPKPSLSTRAPESKSPTAAGTPPTAAATTAPASPSAGVSLAPTSPPAGSPTAASSTGAAVDDVSPTPVVGLPVAAAGATSGPGTPWPALLVAALLAALAGGTYVRRRRR